MRAPAQADTVSAWLQENVWEAWGGGGGSELVPLIWYKINMPTVF